MKSFKFFFDGRQQPPFDNPEPQLIDGLWGILYRDRYNNLFHDNVKLDGNEYGYDDWDEYDTGFITMDYFFHTYRGYLAIRQPFIEPVVRSIECNGLEYDIRYPHVRRAINSCIWEPNLMVRIKGKKLRR